MVHAMVQSSVLSCVLLSKLMEGKFILFISQINTCVWMDLLIFTKIYLPKYAHKCIVFFHSHVKPMISGLNRYTNTFMETSKISTGRHKVSKIHKFDTQLTTDLNASTLQSSFKAVY